MKALLVFIILIVLGSAFKLTRKWDSVKPPPPKYGYNSKIVKNSGNRFLTWNVSNETNVWEHSGLFEGDIMTYESNTRNGILNETRRWPNATVPFYIDQSDFTEDQVMVILKAIQEYHNRTCIRFRPYEETDENWIIIKGNSTGCWSSVGMREKGQVVNISTPKCVKHGVVLHELLHALGFFHQQSSSDRDDYVKINWENILEKHEFNFRKYNESVVTSYGIEYDYGSIMHYSAKAFSKNGEPTIEALEKDVQLGQRKQLSEKDVKKLNKMYQTGCNMEISANDSLKEFIDELIKIFGNNISNLINKIA